MVLVGGLVIRLLLAASILINQLEVKTAQMFDTTGLYLFCFGNACPGLTCALFGLFLKATPLTVTYTFTHEGEVVPRVISKKIEHETLGGRADTPSPRSTYILFSKFLCLCGMQLCK